jgi:hypothetical protein
MPIKLTTYTFIEKAKLVHGNRYDYSNVCYESSSTKVSIICSLHGAFKQSPNKHLMGCGCSSCSRDNHAEKSIHQKQANMEKLVKYFQQQFPEYTYQTNITNSTIQVECAVHGISQTPYRSGNHNIYPCAKCGQIQAAINQTYTNEQYVDLALAAHNNTYEYKVVNNIIFAVCKKHGSFELSGNRKANHLNRLSGCVKCKLDHFHDTYTTPESDFISKASDIHSSKYDYANVEYYNTHTKVKIICSTHGEFVQTPLNHLQGSGCPWCAWLAKAQFSVGGFTLRRFTNHPELKVLPGMLYIIKATNLTEQFVKVGITTKTVEERFKFNSVFPYNYEVIGTRSGQLFDMFKLEQASKKQLNQYKHRPAIKFNGYTECFKLEALSELLKITYINTPLSLDN